MEEPEPKENALRSGSIRRHRGTFAAVVVLSMLASGLFAANAFAQSDTPSGETVFTYADTSEPSSLNPLVGYLGTDYIFWAMSYNIPIEFSAKDYSPDYDHSIVTSVDTSSDSMTFTYHMRPGMEWSDGQPYTANDVAWTYSFYIENNVSNYAADVKLMDSVTATDDTTFVIKSKQPTSFYSGDSVFLYDYILPEHIWNKYENDYKAAKQFDNVPNVGAGPYLISEYEQGQSVTMVRNPNYWGTTVGLTPHYDKIIYVIYNNEDAEAAALQNGEIDFAYIDSANILKNLATKPNIVPNGAAVPSFEQLAINTGSASQTNPSGGFKPHGTSKHSLTDPVVRRAIRQAVDSQTIVDKVLLGYGWDQISPVQPTATTGDWQPSAEQALPFDIAAANKSLDAAGYAKGSDGVRVDPFDGKPLEYEYYTRNSDQNTIETAPFIKDWLTQIGIKLNIHSVSNGKLTTILEEGTYDIYDWGWYPNPDPQYILGIFTCEQRPVGPGIYGNNDSYYCNPEYDKLFDQQATAPTFQDRQDIVHQMQSILYDEQPYVMLYHADVLQAYRDDRVTGFSPQPAPVGEVTGDLLATYGPFSFISIRPAEGSTGETKSKGASSTVWILLVVAAIAVIGGFAILRRRRMADEDAR
jgi:peptide/nickel transport system substrate-binding protein